MYIHVYIKHHGKVVNCEYSCTCKCIKISKEPHTQTHYKHKLGVDGCTALEQLVTCVTGGVKALCGLSMLLSFKCLNSKYIYIFIDLYR
jgi:hypothetical protein